MEIWSDVTIAGRTDNDEQGKIGLLSQGTKDGWDEQLLQKNVVYSFFIDIYLQFFLWKIMLIFYDKAFHNGVDIKIYEIYALHPMFPLLLLAESSMNDI